MVQTYHDKSTLDIPFAILCPVYFLRYPNALATHVLSVDVLSREIVARPAQQDPSSSSSAQSGTTSQENQRHVLRTTRLILKRGTLPKWAPAGIIRNAESWVLEESEVDLDQGNADNDVGASATKTAQRPGREMRCWTRNLNHANVMAVTESNVFSERCDNASPVHADKNALGTSTPSLSPTDLLSRYDVESEVGFSLLRHRIEKFGYNRVLTHVDTSRQGLQLTYARFLSERQNVPEFPQWARTLAAAQSHDGDTRTMYASTSSSASPSSSGPPSKRQRLLAALRPPFLDGDFVGPIARLRKRGYEVRAWWKSLVRGGSADREYMWLRKASHDEQEAHGEQNLTPMERLRKRFLFLRDGASAQHQQQQ